jgi:hypothetical protein
VRVPGEAEKEEQTATIKKGLALGRGGGECGCAWGQEEAEAEVADEVARPPASCWVQGRSELLDSKRLIH